MYELIAVNPADVSPRSGHNSARATGPERELEIAIQAALHQHGAQAQEAVSSILKHIKNMYASDPALALDAALVAVKKAAPGSFLKKRAFAAIIALAGRVSDSERRTGLNAVMLYSEPGGAAEHKARQMLEEPSAARRPIRTPGNSALRPQPV